jgi:shikimate kinase
VVTPDANAPDELTSATTPSGGTRPVAVVVGPPGAGKTTVGRALAQRLGVAFHDVDAAIESTEGRSISDIFVDDGEPVFRDLERAEVARSLAEEAGVVALGGGAVMDPLTEDALRGHVVVFLDVAIADASRRIGFDKSRPLLAVNPRASWVAMMNSRRPTYERVASVRVDTAGKAPEAIVDEIVVLLEAAPA